MVQYHGPEPLSDEYIEKISRISSAYVESAGGKV
jgi:hypothetical protein